MNCPKCGYSIPDFSRFCPNCGTNIEPGQNNLNNNFNNSSNNFNNSSGNFNNGGNNPNNKKLLIIIIALLAVLVIIFAFIAGSMFNRDDSSDKATTEYSEDYDEDEDYEDDEDYDEEDEEETETVTHKKTTKHKTTKQKTTAYVEPYSAFYGVWCGAFKNNSDAQREAEKLRNKGYYNADVYISSEWSNMNKEKWYCVTADVCASKSDANSVLSGVKSYYSDAYVKYSGSYLGSGYEQTTAAPGYESTYPGFYGVWCAAYKKESDAQREAQKLRDKGFYNADVYLSSEWKNLNSEPYYCVAADECNTKSEANSVLSRAKKYYKSAYVKHTGEYKY